MQLSEKKTINLLVTLNHHYLEPLKIMLYSFGEHHRDCVTELYIVHSSLTAQDFGELAKEIADFQIHIHNIKITERYFKDTPVLARISEESFYRLLAFQYLPEEVERCLYLDPDVLIRKNMLSFYTMDLCENYIAGAGHLHGIHNTFNKARLGLKNQKKYVNSGVMLMNLTAIRRDFTLEKVLDCLKENAQWLIMGDQDMVNLLFGSKTVFVDERIYNLDERTFRYHQRHNNFTLTDVETTTAIVHYNGKYKPWLEGYKGELNCFYPVVNPKGPAPHGMIKKQIKSIYYITHPTKQQTVFIVGILSCLCVCLFSYFFFGSKMTGLLSDPVAFRSWLDQLGAFDEIVFILIRAAQTVVKFIPAEPLEIASGYAWGAIPGMLYCVLGNIMGTIAIFVLSRKFGQKFIELFLPVKNMKTLWLFKSSDKIYALLFFLYLIPGSPKDGFTYFVGFLPVKFVPFMLVTGIARMPSVLSSTLCGATLADKQYWISALIFAATILLAIIGGIIYHTYTKKAEARQSIKREMS